MHVMKIAGRDFSGALAKLVEDIDLGDVQREVEELRDRYPDASKDDLAAKLTRRAAMKAAGTGAVAGAAGGAFALLALAPDIWNLLRQQSRLVLAIGLVWGVTPAPAERAREVLATLAASTGTALARRGAARLAEKAVAEAAARAMFGRLVVRRAAALAPIAGSAVAGAANWAAVSAVGKAAAAHYRSRVAEAAPDQ